MPLVDTTVDIPFVDLRAQYESIKEEVDTVMADVIKNTAFVGVLRPRVFLDT